MMEFSFYRAEYYVGQKGENASYQYFQKISFLKMIKTQDYAVKCQSN